MVPRLALSLYVGELYILIGNMVGGLIKELYSCEKRSICALYWCVIVHSAQMWISHETIQYMVIHLQRKNRKVL